MRPNRRIRRLGLWLRDRGRLHWDALTRAGRISIAGVAASALLAIALGVLIPRVVADQALGARLEAAASLVRVLERQRLVPPVGDHLVGEAYQRFDQVVREGLLGGENVRVKLWNLSGEIIYSDEPRLVGRRFPVGPNLEAALSGEPSAEISRLDDAENRFERHLGARALELYLPLRGAHGEVMGALEVYQDVDPLAGHLAVVRRAVWLSVGTGLSVLLLFLIALFAATARVMDRERRAAEDRAEDLEILLRTARILSTEPSLDRTGPRVLSALTTRLGLRCGGVVFDENGEFSLASAGAEGMCPAAAEVARAVREAHRDEILATQADACPGHAEPGARCALLGVRFRAGPDAAGALVVCRGADRPFDVRERVLVSSVAGAVGIAGESARLFAELRGMTSARGRLLRRLVKAQEEERGRLVGDLHDDLGQALTRILWGLHGSRARLPAGEEEIDRELARLEALVDEQSRSLRRYMTAIRPAVLEDFGLPVALEAFAREQEAETGLTIEVRVEHLPELDPTVGVVLFRAAQEAVMNVRKHAEATRLTLRLGQEDRSVVLQVQDDGRGSERIRDGIGLASMRDRAASLGGHVEVVSSPGEGTLVTVRMPAEVGDGDDPGTRR